MIEVIIAVALAWIRLAGHKSLSFQAIAHGFVAYLFTRWWDGKGRWYLYLGITIALVEVYAFLNL